MDGNQAGYSKKKTVIKKVIRIERYTNNTRTVKPVFAVLQMINLYQRKLRRAQANHRRIAPWSKAVLPSHDLELVDGTLFIKGKRRLVGLLERLESYSDAKNEIELAEAGERSPKPSETSTFSPRTRSCSKNVRYDASVFEEDDDDNDSDFEISKSGKKTKRNGVTSWLSSRLQNGKQKASKPGKKSKKMSENLEEIGRSGTNEPKENVDEEADEAQRENDDQENVWDKDIKISFKSRVFRVFGKNKAKSGLKREAESDILLIDSGQEQEDENGVVNNEASIEQPKSPQRKRKKVHEPMFNCPMCDKKFPETQINEHAFSCNAEPTRESRSQIKDSDKSPDFIPVENDLGFFAAKGAQPKASKSNWAVKENDFSEWQTACEKISTGKATTNAKGSKDRIYINDKISFQSLANDSALINEQLKVKDQNQRKLADHVNARKPVKPTLIREPTASKGSKPVLGSNWLSEDSDENSEEKDELINQYLDNGNNGRVKTKTRREKSRKKPAFVEEDSIDMNDNDEKCFVCSRTLYGKSQSEYKAHVVECISREEARMQASEDVDGSSSQNFAEDSEIATENGKLTARLGNRKSWNKFSNMDQPAEISEQEEDMSVEQNESDSPIKTFKPVSDSSLFNFDNQFKANMPKNGQKRRKSNRRKRK